MWMPVYVDMCVCMIVHGCPYVCMYVYVCVCVCLRKSMSIHVYVCVCVYACGHVCI